MSPRLRTLALRTRAADGFTMIITIGVLAVTSLMIAAAFTIANGEVLTTRRDSSTKQSYYAALAGIQQYEYKLQANPSYWSSCEAPKSTVPEEESERYEIVLLPASTAPVGTTTCNPANPFNTMIEAKGSMANTFRIKSIGYSGAAKRVLIATFKVSGFLDYIYFTNFETEDPELYGPPSEECAGHYHKEWSEEKHLKCETITFTSGDSVEGPMHTNDATKVEGSASFGREGVSPADTVEILEGTYPEDEGFKCGGGKPTFNTTGGCYTKGSTLLPPESDSSLAAYVESENHFEGQTFLTLNGSSNKISVANWTEVKAGEYKEVKSTINWPKNGLIFVSEKNCNPETYSPNTADTTSEQEKRRGCGDVYVSGTYSKPLTIAGATDVIINGNIYPTNVEGKVGAEPSSSSTAVLGLIATDFIRVYHPCSGGTNQAGSLSEPWIYAAILSTSHSFLVDNFKCGAKLGELHVWGAIAQNYRGIVGTIGATGYIKDYKYDQRLRTDEPPYFIAPLKAGWKIVRQTAPGAG